jgi:hypothetical protein
MAWGYSSMVEFLPTLRKVLDSIPGSTKTKHITRNVESAGEQNKSQRKVQD